MKAGDAIDASIPMHGEGCIPQAAALRMSELNECQRRMTVICVLRMREKTLYTGSLLIKPKSELVYGTSWGTLQSLRSLWPRTVQTSVSVWHPTGSASSLTDVFPDPRGGEADVSLALPRWCAMQDEKPAPSEPWSGSAYWTQVLEPVMLRASPVCPCIPGPAKQRSGLRELGLDFCPRVHPFPTIPTRFSTLDALLQLSIDSKQKVL